MKHLSIEKSRQVMRLEFADESCEDILTDKVRELRFDIVMDKDDSAQHLYRVKVRLGEDDLPVLELRDYRDNSRNLIYLEPSMTLSEVSTIALNTAWNLYEGHEIVQDVSALEEQP